MLTVNQILDLNKQGFSAEQIEYLNSLQQPETGDTLSFSPAPVDQGDKPGEAAPTVTPATSATPPEDPTTGEAIKALSSQIAALSDTVKAMQAVNAQKAEQQIPQKVTAESIIKDFFGKKEGR